MSESKSFFISEEDERQFWADVCDDYIQALIDQGYETEFSVAAAGVHWTPRKDKKPK